MNIFKNSVPLKIGAMAVIAVVTYLSITSACANCNDASTYGNVCFTCNLGSCNFPSGSQFCMENSTCSYVQDGVGTLIYGTPQCCTLGGGTPIENVVGDVEVPITGGLYDLGVFRFTWAEAGGATSCDQAETWFHSTFPSPPFTVGLLNCFTPNIPCQVCVQKEPTCAVDGSDVYPEGYRDIGWIKCPNGDSVLVSPTSYDEQLGATECGDTYLNVTLQGVPPCPTVCQ